MYAEMENPNRLKVLLTKEDMERFHITYDELDYTNPQTKIILTQVLEYGKANTKFRPKKAQLFIEAYPTEEGGCLLYYTIAAASPVPAGPRFGGSDKASEDKQEKRGPEVPLIFAFDNLELLTQAAARLFGRYCSRIYKSSLYRAEHQYMLIIYPAGRMERFTACFLSEYGRFAGKGELAAALIEEHCPILMEGNAIDTIAMYL